MKNASQFGIEVSEPSIHFSSVQHRKETIIDELYKGITYLMKKNKIDVYKGRGRILGPSIFLRPLARFQSNTMTGRKYTPPSQVRHYRYRIVSAFDRTDRCGREVCVNVNGSVVVNTATDFDGDCRWRSDRNRMGIPFKRFRRKSDGN